MRVSKDFGKVRIVLDGSPFEVVYDIRVEWLIEGEWKLFAGFNSLSDDYAMTNANSAAARAMIQLEKESETHE